MGKRMSAIRRFFAALGLSVGVMLALPGCGSAVKTPQEMSTDVADKTNNFADALKNNDLDRMKNIRDEAKEKNKELDDEENKRIDNGESIDDILVQRILLENQLVMYDDVIKKYEENNYTIPKSSSLVGKIGDGVGSLAGHALDFLDGDPIYDTTAIATEYAKNYPDYEAIAKADRELFKEWFGKEFQDVQDAKGAFGEGVMGALTEISRLTGTKFAAVANAFKQGLQDYESQVSTDQYGNYVNVDNLAWLDMEAATINVKIGKWLKITDPNNPAEFHFYENPDYDNSNYEEDYKKAKEEMYGGDQR